MSAKSTTRRAAVVTAATVSAVASAVVAGPASADTPQGWETYHMEPLHLLIWILFVPLGVAIVVSLLVLLPGVLRGERLIPTGDEHREAQPPATVDHRTTVEHH